MSYEDRLRHLAIHELEVDAESIARLGLEPVALDSRTLALARLAALIAMTGPASSYGEVADAALNAGATPDDCVDVLVDIVGIVGSARVAEAAPTLAMALGYDIDAALGEP